MKYARSITVLSLLLFLSLLFHRTELNKFPSTIHAWAQADRYAIALGFVRNGLDFFKPESYVLNHQFPGNWKEPHNASITAVDFPIHDFIPALFMKILGTQSIWIFRLYVLLYSLAGLFFLFKLSYQLNRDQLKSLFIVIFAASSPVFVFYQAGTLPTIPSLSNAIIGLYFYSQFIRTHKHTKFGIAILFLTVATLGRTTFAIPLIAIFGLEFLRIIIRRTSILPKLVPVIASVISILSYYFYNNHLRHTYGSDFLAHFMPAQSFGELINFLRLSLNQWMLHYFSLPQYILFGLILILSIGLIFLKNGRSTLQLRTLVALTGIMIIGNLIFTVLMIRQFPAHDYYFLDTYFLPLILLLVLCISFIPSPKTKSFRILYVFMLTLFSATFIIKAHDIQTHRNSAVFHTRVGNTINNFMGSGSILDSLGISKQAKILVLDAYAPNIPFIMMDRKGYAVMTTTKENLQEALDWDFDLLVYQNEFFYTDIYHNFPGIIKNLEKYHDTGKVTFCLRSDLNPDQDLFTFEQLDKAEPRWSSVLSFDETSTIPDWNNIVTTDTHQFSGTRSAAVDSNMLYGPVLKLRNRALFNHRQSKLYFGGQVLRSGGDCSLIVSLRQNEANIYYEKLAINNLVKEFENWEKIELVLEIPRVKGTDCEFALYVLNEGGGVAYFDDLTVKIY